eukprot:gene13034-17468_t
MSSAEFVINLMIKFSMIVRLLESEDPRCFGKKSGESPANDANNLSSPAPDFKYIIPSLLPSSQKCNDPLFYA